MASKNRAVIVLTLLVVLGLFSLAGAIVWLGYRLQPGSESPSASSTSPTVAATAPLDPNLLAQVPLESDRNVDYSQLRAALQRQDWQAADRETYERLLEAAGPQALAQGFTPQSEMDTLSCKDLRTVDRLWSQASGGKFGFTAQQSILRALGDYRKMYDQVGWQRLSGEWLLGWNYNVQTQRMDYKPGQEPDSTTPPPGHFPTVERGYNFGVSLDAALDRCQF
ncbi:MAG: GUN4 domain-containing protein [Microcoleus sp. SIO2G3]|nr:GUN4 domain-containing protein [Microcoleus sp. SIO2G3]